MACLHFSFLCVSTQFPSLNGCIFASTSWVLLLMYSLVLMRIAFADSFEGRAIVLIMAVDRILFMFTLASLSAPFVILFFILVCCILLLYFLRPDSAYMLFGLSSDAALRCLALLDCTPWSLQSSSQPVQGRSSALLAECTVLLDA